MRKPIPDHGVPRAPEHMAEIQAELDAALARGRRVYVHCRAGIGRTGTVVACHLIEQGLTPDAALIRLNELWQDNERSATWPDVPETDEQRDYILGWSPAVDPTQSPDVMDAARTLRERFQGALVGLAVGDALAAHTQFRKPGTFAAVGDLLGGGPFDQPRGAWTDDTAMALLLAESLLEREGFDAHDQVQRYVRWQREGYGSATGQCVGISANVARALATAQYKRQPFAGSHDPEQLDKDPLSRVAPVGHVLLRRRADRGGQGGRSGAPHRAGADGARLRAPAGRHGPPGAVGPRQGGRPAPAARAVDDRQHPAGGAGALRRVLCAPQPAGNHRRRRNPAGARGGALGIPPHARPFARAPCSPPTSAATRMWWPRPMARSPAPIMV